MGRAPDHIIDVLIAERAPRLAKSAAWPIARPALYALLGYRQARSMADAFQGRSGAEAFEHVSGILKLDLTVKNLDRVPEKGRVIVVCNHPTGIADGEAVWDALKARRPDLLFFANSDALRISERFSEVIIPVEWVEEKRTREQTRQTLTRAREALEGERCLIVFPAGRLATRQQGALSDPPWQSSAVSLARRHHAPIAPVHIAGPASILFHFFDKFSRELRDITLFHELLNKRGKRFDLTVGPLITPERFAADVGAATLALKAYVEKELALSGGDAPFGYGVGV